MITVHHGDCVEVMATMEAESVDAVVCDPPYGLEFMGKEWDRLADTPGYNERGRITDRPDAASAWVGAGGRGVNSFQAGRPMQDWHERWAREAFRVLKPGGHLLAFGGTRTYHRLACAVEDAGFEIRDSITWIYGSGFPKSLDVSKAIDKAAGAGREVVGSKLGRPGMAVDGSNQDFRQWRDTEGREDIPTSPLDITAPATPEAQRWDGWGTALKPAHEPIVVGRKPLIGTVVANVLEFGTGALNIDGCRIGTDYEGPREGESSADRNYRTEGSTDFTGRPGPRGGSPDGRWPANIILSHSEGCVEVGTREVPREVRVSHAEDTPGKNTYGSNGPGGGSHSEGSVPEVIGVWRCVDGCPVAEMDEQSGQTTTSKPGTVKRHQDHQTTSMAGTLNTLDRAEVAYGDTGGASRFFYVAKASRSDRTDGLPRAWYEEAAKNGHPTVKPVELMRHLVRLVTPPGGTVLDPFLGSGTTGIAAVREGFDFIGIEKNDEYVKLARTRIERTVEFLAEPQAMF